MPLRLRFYPWLLAAAVAPSLVGAEQLGWMTRDEIAALPAEEQRPVQAWCHGTYINPGLGEPDPRADTVITADRSRLTPDGLAELLGDVEIEQPGRRLRADSASMNQDSGDFSLAGSVRADSGLFSFRADSMTGNTRREEATLTGVRYALFDIHARGGAAQVEQRDQRVFIQDGSYTTCPPDQRGWAIHARNIELDRERGWGSARHIVLRVRDVPTLYLPWMTFPIDDRRKTGLLFPSLSLTDDGGIDFAQPIYFNIHPQFDATLAPRHIQNRGTGFDSQARYLTTFGEGEFNYGLISNDRRADGEDRVLANWRHTGQVERWTLSSDVNYVSDDFYFKDLESGLDVRAQTNLPRQAEALYRGRTWQFLTRVQAWQTIDPTLPDADLPYRRLPQFALTGRPRLAGPLHGLWVSDFTRFDRSTDDLTANVTGDRLHLQPALTLPLTRSWGYIEPRARLYYTRYELDGVAAGQGESPERDLWGVSLDSGLFLERPFELNERAWQQTLEPRLFYSRIAFEDQDDLPNFDAGQLTFGYGSLFRENRFTGYDRIGDEEKLAMGLTSRFLDSDSGREALRLRLGQAYFFRDRQVQLDGDPVDDRTWSPVVADTTWYLNRYWQVFAETQWDRENDRREQNSLRVGYVDGERRVAHVGYRYRDRDDITQTELAAIWPVHRNWSLIGRWLYDVEDNRSLENLVGLEYRDCCWQLRVLGLRELTDRTGDGLLEADQRYMLQIQMLGLGGFSGRVESLLERTIPGYGRQYGTNY